MRHLAEPRLGPRSQITHSCLKADGALADVVNDAVEDTVGDGPTDLDGAVALVGRAAAMPNKLLAEASEILCSMRNSALTIVHEGNVLTDKIYDFFDLLALGTWGSARASQVHGPM